MGKATPPYTTVALSRHSPQSRDSTTLTNPSKSSSSNETVRGQKNSTPKSRKKEFTWGVSKLFSFSLPLSTCRLQELKRSARVNKSAFGR